MYTVEPGLPFNQAADSAQFYADLVEIVGNPVAVGVAMTKRTDRYTS